MKMNKVGVVTCILGVALNLVSLSPASAEEKLRITGS